MKHESSESDYLPNPYAYKDRPDIDSKLPSDLSVEDRRKLGVMPKKSKKEKEEEKIKKEEKSRLSFKVSELSNSEDDKSEHSSDSEEDDISANIMKDKKSVKKNKK